ncbi:MAG: vitamin K epoxide reductase family protein [Candidatus Poseidoniales archaeon]|nr:vitamin K epoxide reductase family protein [Candidatus Poseidoniales archaeon]
MVEYGPLTVFLAIMAIGGLIASNQKIPQLEEMGKMRRRLLGLFVIEMGGLAASGWTLMIHNQMVTGGSEFCAAEGIVQCGSVIGDPIYSEFFGVPWGVIGIGAFSVLGWLTLSMFLEMKADWAKSYADYAWWLSLPSIPGIGWLVLVELFLVEGAPHICPYCTSVHIALIACMYILYTIRKERDEGTWEVTAQLSKADLLAKARKK